MPKEMEVFRKFAHYRPEFPEDEIVVEDPVPVSKREAKEILRKGQTKFIDMVGLA